MSNALNRNQLDRRDTRGPNRHGHSQLPPGKWRGVATAPVEYPHGRAYRRPGAHLSDRPPVTWIQVCKQSGDRRVWGEPQQVEKGEPVSTRREGGRPVKTAKYRV